MCTVCGMEDINTVVAANVRAALARHKITQAVVADALELSRTSVSHRLNGTAKFTLVELAKVADLTGLDITEFFRGTSKAAGAA